MCERPDAQIMQEMGSTNSYGRGDSRANSGAWATWAVTSAIHAAATRPGGPAPAKNADVRASDKERSEAMDLLGSHFAEGRLDQSELDERLQVAASAKTRGELAGLLSDLPAAERPPAPAPAPVYGCGLPRWRVPSLLLVVVLAAVLVGAAGHVAPALLVGFAIVALLRSRRRRRQRAAYHDHLHAHGTPHWHAGRQRVIADVQHFDRD